MQTMYIRDKDGRLLLVKCERLKQDPRLAVHRAIPAGDGLVDQNGVRIIGPKWFNVSDWKSGCAVSSQPMRSKADAIDDALERLKRLEPGQYERLQAQLVERWGVANGGGA